MAAQVLKPVECSAQPLSLAFHPDRENLVAVGLVDGTVECKKCGLEVHEFDPNVPFTKTAKRGDDQMEDSEDDEDDTIISSLPVHCDGTVPKPSKRKPAEAGSDINVLSSQITAERAPSCRVIMFSKELDMGKSLYTAGNSGDICCIDTELGTTPNVTENKTEYAVKWRVKNAHPHGINAMHELPACSPAGPLLVTGDDEGMVRIWDPRLCESVWSESSKPSAKKKAFDNLMENKELPPGCVASWNQNTDYISCFDTDKDGKTLLATSADGKLSIFDVRQPGKKIGTDHIKAKAATKIVVDPTGARLSDDQEDELLSVIVMKKGKKVVCGTQEGILSIWSWGVWGDVSDRFPGHPSSIDALLKVDEDTFLTGSSDGLVRIVQIHPDRLLGILGDHDGFPVESLHFSANKKYVGSISHDALIRLWDASIFCDDDEDEDIDDEDETDAMDLQNEQKSVKSSGLAAVSSSRAGVSQGSDDEWEDIDDDEDMSDSSVDSDDSGSKGQGKNKQPSRVFKTETEKFFEDL
eukprot:scaffold33389_cov54-Attheya_sp.AAC.5